MPLHHIIAHDETTRIYVWKITESQDQLLSEVILNEKSQSRLQNMKSEMHRRGFLSVRKLLEYNGYNDFDLYYDVFGKPHLHDGRHISITHSHEFSAIILSDTNTGIDIEKQREKIKVIADKFTAPLEETYLDTETSDYISKLTVIWGAKESQRTNWETGSCLTVLDRSDWFGPQTASPRKVYSGGQESQACFR